MTMREPEPGSTPAEPQPGGYENEIVIAPDGAVLFRHLDEALLTLAAELDPRDLRIPAVLRELPR
jgi:hypothetical protein